MVFVGERRFRIALARAGFRSVARLAAYIGVSANYGRQVAKGLVPSAAVRERLAEALEIDAGELWQAERAAKRAEVEG